jgi:hypothetical protein
MTNHAMDQAVRAWIDASVVICAHRGAFKGETADEIMARHGITFDGDRALYMATEREIRARANVVLGLESKRSRHHHGPRGKFVPLGAAATPGLGIRGPNGAESVHLSDHGGAHA